MPSSPRFAFALFAVLAAPLAAQEIAVEELPQPTSQEPVAVARSTDLAAVEQEALRLYSEGDLAGSLALYLDLSKRHPETRERARLALTAAWLTWQLEDQPSALAHLEAALFEAPDLEFRADLYAPEFAALYQDALRNAVHRRRVVASETINRAVGEIRARRYGPARALLLEALALTPNDPDGLYNLAVVDLREKRDDAALAGFERVLALERGDPEGVTRMIKSQALNNSAVIYFSRGAYEEAEAALAEAVALDAGDGHAWFNLGLARQRLGREAEAYEALRRARALMPDDASVARALALVEVERKNWISAVALLVEAAGQRPDDPDLALQLGRAQRGLGNLEGAVASFRRGVELDPADARKIGGTAALLLAETLRERGDLAGSGQAAEQATRLRPNDGGAWMLLGLSRQAAGDTAGARDALERARELAPGRADVAHNLGSVYLSLRDPVGAEEAFAAALAIDPGNADTRAALEALHARPAPPPNSRSREVGAELVAAADPATGVHGLRVGAVQSGSPAARAGLRPGDLILRAAERPVESPDALRRVLKDARGAPAALAVMRRGQPLELRLTLD